MKQKIYPFLVLLTCFSITGVAITLNFSCAGVFYTPVSEYFGVSRGVYALTNSVMGIIMGFAAPYWGKLLKKYSLKWMLTGVLVSLAVTYIAMSKFTAIWPFFFSSAVFGVAQGLLMILITPAIITRWFSKRVGFLVGLSSSMSGVGGIIINPIAGRIIATSGWQPAFFFYGMLVACIPLPLVLFILRDHPEDIGIKPWGADDDDEAASGTKEARGMTLAEVRKHPAFIALIIYNICCTSSNCFSAYVPSYGQSLGMDIQKAAVLASFFSIGILIGKNCVGTICDKSKKLGVSIATLGPALGLLLMLIIANHIPGVLQTGATLYGITYCGNTVLAPLLVRDIFGEKDDSHITGEASKLSQILGSFYGPVFGFVSGYRFGFMIILMFSMVANIVGFMSCQFALKRESDFHWREEE